MKTNGPADPCSLTYKISDDQRVMLVVNTASKLKNFNIRNKYQIMSNLLNASSVITYVW